jgi:hypothetical protein
MLMMQKKVVLFAAAATIAALFGGAEANRCAPTAEDATV